MVLVWILPPLDSGSFLLYHFVRKKQKKEVSSSTLPTLIVLNIGEEVKRPVGRPRKVNKGPHDSASRLVDYSSSSEEDKIEEVGKKNN